MMIGILGGTGFVGRNLYERLKQLGCNCCVAARTPVDWCEFDPVDARESKSIYNWIQQRKIDTVVNLAAECGGIGRNRAHPADLWLSTTLISAATLNACVARSVKRLIMVGTVCSYAAECPVPFSEDYLMHYGPPESTNRAYGLAKLSALYGAQAFEQQYGLSVCNLIAVNMYGPYDNFSLQSSHVIPAMIRKINMAHNMHHAAVTLWGTGKPTREFLHVRDFSDAVWLAATTESVTSEFINVGSASEVSMSDLAAKISSIVGYGGEIVWDPSQPDGQMRRCLDTAKAESRLGFSSKIDLDRGLNETIAWYLKEAQA